MPIHITKTIVLGGRKEISGIAKYIRARLYGGTRKIGWGYYKDLPKGMSPDDNSFNRKLELVPVTDGMTVVDIGCGYGWFSQRLGTLCPKSTIYGLEVSTACIDSAKASNKLANVHYAVFKERFVEALPPATRGKTDVVFLIGVLNELTMEQCRSVLDDVQEQLHPQGKAYVSFIDWKTDHWDFLPLAYIHYMLPKNTPKADILQMCDELGYSIAGMHDSTPYSCVPHFESNRSNRSKVFGPCLAACYRFIVTRFLQFTEGGDLRVYNMVLEKKTAEGSTLSRRQGTVIDEP